MRFSPRSFVAGLLVACAAVLRAEPLPDLVVTAFRPEGGKGVEYESVRFEAIVKNIGTASTPAGSTISVTFQLVENGKPRTLTYSSTWKGPLAPGEEHTVVSDGYWTAIAGDHEILSVVDDIKRIKESDRTNNTLSCRLTVAPNAAVRAALPAEAAPPAPAPSAMEALPNGSFTERDAGGKLVQWEGKPVEMIDGIPAIAVRQGVNLEWDARDRLVWDADYILSFYVKTIAVEVPSNPVLGVRAVLWPRLPDQHEPPGGPIYSKFYQGTAGWQRVEIPFLVQPGVSRFLAFLEGSPGMNGLAYFTHFSVRPANPRELPASSGPLLGVDSLEQMTWIWSRPGFNWTGGVVRQTTTLVLGADMARAMNEPVPALSAWFRRKVTLPAGVRDVQAVFVGDDRAELLVDGRSVASNQIWQDIVRVPLERELAPGREHEILFKVDNAFGLAGLLGRIQWTNTNGTVSTLPTNGRWESSEDAGATWKPAEMIATPPPALTAFDWAYSHLPRRGVEFRLGLPGGVTSARFRGRATNTFRFLADNRELAAVESAGVSVGIDFGDALARARMLTVRVEEMGLQPAAGDGVLEVTTTAGTRLVPLSEFKLADGSAPRPLALFESGKTWPISLFSFEAAATRPLVSERYVREAWVTKLLAGSTPIWQVGTPDGSSAEFNATASPARATPATSLKEFPRGLEQKTKPALALDFELPSVPRNGAAFVLDVEDADAVVGQCAVFVNDTLCGLLQLVGYDQFPGGRLTQRAWAVTIDPFRLRTGRNTIELRMLAPYTYKDGGGNAGSNQSEEFIRRLNLGERSRNPYPTSNWVHWDALSLHALAAAPASPINGRPVHLGTNAGKYMTVPAAGWKEWIFRDLQYMGFTGTGAPLRVSGFTPGYLRDMQTLDPGLPDGVNRGTFVFKTLQDLGLTLELVCEPGRGIRTPADLPASHEAALVREFGQYASMLEIGNEVDHPHYGFDRFSLAQAAASIMKESAAGQKIAALRPGPPLPLTGQGWYHAWDFSIIDAQARAETPADPGFTQTLSAHSYGQSYIIPAVCYRTLYGPTLGDRDIWMTECGAWTPNDTDIDAFDMNLRGNIAYATHIVQYMLHVQTPRHRQFSVFSSHDADAQVLEKARTYRRLILAYSVQGAALPWRTLPEDKTAGQPVLVRAVDAGKWWKISLVNFSRDPQTAAIEVGIPAGKYQAVRYGDGRTVAEGTRSLTLAVNPRLQIRENLSPGESIEYLITRR